MKDVFHLVDGALWLADRLRDAFMYGQRLLVVENGWAVCGCPKCKLCPSNRAIELGFFFPGGPGRFNLGGPIVLDTIQARSNTRQPPWLSQGMGVLNDGLAIQR
ncbi:hypothetical protein BaRGS_00027583 [Batillaria attramentaria]|uniref:Uncharacterized protein n=1 Tax=Batillaria attramentaria TaxID=370345 RepID=A0ABD0K2R9_9CAEN